MKTHLLQEDLPEVEPLLAKKGIEVPDDHADKGKGSAEASSPSQLELPVQCTDGWSVSSTIEVVPFPSLTQDVH